MRASVMQLTNENDLDADAQLGPYPIGGIYGLVAGNTERETCTVAETQAQPPGLGLETCSGQRIYIPERHNLDVDVLDVAGELVGSKTVASDACRYFRKVDARYANRIENLGNYRGPRFIEQVGEQC